MSDTHPITKAPVLPLEGTRVHMIFTSSTAPDWAPSLGGLQHRLTAHDVLEFGGGSESLYQAKGRVYVRLINEDSGKPLSRWVEVQADRLEVLPAHRQFSQHLASWSDGALIEEHDRLSGDSIITQRQRDVWREITRRGLDSKAGGPAVWEDPATYRVGDLAVVLPTTKGGTSWPFVVGDLVEVLEPLETTEATEARVIKSTPERVHSGVPVEVSTSQLRPYTPALDAPNGSTWEDPTPTLTPDQLAKMVEGTDLDPNRGNVPDDKLSHPVKWARDVLTEADLDWNYDPKAPGTHMVAESLVATLSEASHGLLDKAAAYRLLDDLRTWVPSGLSPLARAERIWQKHMDDQVRFGGHYAFEEGCAACRMANVLGFEFEDDREE